MDDLASDCGAFFKATAFLGHFSDLPDPRQAVKVVYPLHEVAAFVAPGAGRGLLPTSVGSATRDWRSCAGSVRSATAHHRMIASAISLQHSTPITSSAASSPGWPR
jgi:hypothetical protein